MLIGNYKSIFEFLVPQERSGTTGWRLKHLSFDEFGTFSPLFDVDFDIKFSSITTKLIYCDKTSISTPCKEKITRRELQRATWKLRDFSPRDAQGTHLPERWKFSNIFSSRCKLIPRTQRSLSKICFASRCTRGNADMKFELRNFDWLYRRVLRKLAYS